MLERAAKELSCAFRIACPGKSRARNRSHTRLGAAWRALPASGTAPTRDDHESPYHGRSRTCGTDPTEAGLALFTGKFRIRPLHSQDVWHAAAHYRTSALRR
ncbi:hypothetical protein NUTIK01_00530 [Novosphingobium sp. IK01]|uniref:Uncharacterized protein n=1 Tax=Novosphingobium pituita TaxID=3056842 RepID=A0ABQ6P558_9SPHN|nr:hypothetical protein NUTIK01_00530 [Novosphingobium sp. IK01]